MSSKIFGLRSGIVQGVGSVVWGAGGPRLFTHRPGRRDSEATGAVCLHSKEMRLGLMV